MKYAVVFLALLGAGLALALGGCATASRANSAESGPVLMDTEALVYVACEDGDEIAILRARDASLVGSIPVAGAPRDLAYDPHTRRVYVSSGDAGTVSVIATASRSVVEEFQVGGQPQGLALSEDGKSLYVADSLSDNVAVIATSTGAVISTITVGEGPQSLVFAPDYRRLYVVNLRSNDVSAIDPATNRVVKTILGGRGPSGLAVSPDGSRLFLGGHSHPGMGKPTTNKQVMILDAATGKQLGAIETGSMPIALMLAPNGGYLYVICHGSGELWAIDASIVSSSDTNEHFTALSSARIKVGEDPQSLALVGDGRFIYVANAASNDVSVIDTLGNRLVRTVDVGRRPVGLAVVQ